MKKKTNTQTTSNEFSIRLNVIRTSHRLTMREAARRIGVPETTYRDWEYGNAIQGEPYPRIAKAFGISLDELFGVSIPESVEEKLNKIVAITQSLKNDLSR